MKYERRLSEKHVVILDKRRVSGRIEDRRGKKDERVSKYRFLFFYSPPNNVLSIVSNRFESYLDFSNKIRASSAVTGTE